MIFHRIENRVSSWRMSSKKDKKDASMFMRNLLIVNALVARKSIETKREQTSIGTLQHIF